MPENKKNETLEQQRKSRKEFLELKKMQSGEIDSPPKPSEVAIVPKTPVEKLKNIWFHDKYIILGVVALIIIMAITIKQCAGRINYDLQVIAFTYTPLSDSALEKAADYMEKFCDDVNDDGEINIMVINCSMDYKSSNVSYNNTIYTKLQAIFATDANALLYITDKDSYKYFENIEKDANLFAEMPIPLNSDFYANSKTDEDFGQLPEGLQISIRAIDGTVIGKNDNVKNYLKESEKIYTALTK